ncbi:MAG: Cna B-type protein [Bryobacterales bacterium]|nr:Cna B-type protein [Bryobacterales bacterium]
MASKLRHLRAESRIPETGWVTILLGNAKKSAGSAKIIDPAPDPVYNALSTQRGMRLVEASVCLLAVAASGLAQEFRARISGQVTDPSGALVAGAKVVASDLERHLAYEVATNSIGRYSLATLLPGTYTLTVELQGFKKYEHEVALLASDRLSIDVSLSLAGVDTITVFGTPVLQTETATRESTFENPVLENVPSGGRNLFALQYDQPGVVKTSTYWGAMELYAFGNVNAVSIAGGRSGENEIVVDGVTDTKSDRGVAWVPPIAATEEFTVQINSYDAQFGRTGGGVTMINLKSGTNAFHGQLFEYFKNDKIRANDWIANKNGVPTTAFKNNTFGFGAEGPVRRNRTFFTISLEGLRQHNQGGQSRTLPLPEQLRGDFSHLFDANGNLITIYDPLSTSLGPDGKTFVRTPFVGNAIPLAQINNVAAKVASFYPAANLPGDGPAHLNNYLKILPETNTYDAWLGKLDHMLNAKSRVSFHYGQTPWLNYAKLVWGDNPAEPSNQYPSTRVFRAWGADWAYQFTPTLLFNLRAGVSRFETSNGNSFGVNYDPRQLGFPNSLAAQFATLEFPRFNIAGYSEIGSSGVLSYTAQDVWSLQPNVSWIRGKHNVRLGSELRRYNDNNLNPGLASGSYTFDPGWTQANPQRADSLSGNAFASFLLGRPSSGFVDRNIDPAYRSHYYAAYVQDDFKIHPRLSLNLGLRWDYETPRDERYDRMVRGFAFGQSSPIAGVVQASAASANCPACAAGLKGGLLYADSDNRYAFEPHRANFQPRIGVAYRIAPKLIFRGGYSLGYLGQSANGPPTGFSRQTQLTASQDNGLTPAVSLSDPFPVSIFPNGLLQPIGNSQGLATNLGQNIAFQYLDRPLPYSQQYSAGFQYELPAGWLADVSYAGNLTKRLPVTLQLNFIPSDVLNSIPLDQRQAYFNQQVANPMAGLLPNSAFNGSTVPRQQLLYAFPQYGSGSQMTDVPIGQQRYDSAQMKLSRRFSRGFSVTLAYTISKALEQVSTLNSQDADLQNPLNTRLEKRLTQFDVPQQFSVIGTYSLPGNYSYRWMNGIAAGWTLSGVWMSHSGFPLAFPNAGPLEAKSAKLSDAQRDALAQAAGRAQYDPSYDVWFDTSLFPRTAQSPFTLRTFPTRFPDVRSKPLNITDLSLYKEFHLAERVKWQIRVDAHNAANFPWFGVLDSSGNNVTSPLFGHLRADIGNETRVIVGVMRLIF